MENNNISAVSDSGFDVYIDKMHAMGKLWTGIMILVMLSLPVGICLLMGTMPNLSRGFWYAFIPILLMDIPSGLAELAAYSPLLGTGGTYLAFITGNISNLKLPCAMNARDLMHTKVGTVENEIVSTISIAASAITTTIVIAVGVFLMAVTPLSSALENQTLLPAFKTVMPALFGALGAKYAFDEPKCAIVPITLSIITFLLFPQLTSNVSIMVFVFVVVGGLSSLIMYKVSSRKQKLKP